MKKHWKDVLLVALAVGLIACFAKMNTMSGQWETYAVQAQRLSGDVDRLVAENYELRQTIEDLRNANTPGIATSAVITDVQIKEELARVQVTFTPQNVALDEEVVVFTDGSSDQVSAAPQGYGYVAEITLPLREEAVLLYKTLGNSRGKGEIIRIKPLEMLEKRKEVSVYSVPVEDQIQLFPFITVTTDTDGQKIVKAVLSVESGQDTHTWDMMPYAKDVDYAQIFNGYMDEKSNLRLAAGENFLLPEGLFAFEWKGSARVVIEFTDAFGVSYYSQGTLQEEGGMLSMEPPVMK